MTVFMSEATIREPNKNSTFFARTHFVLFNVEFNRFFLHGIGIGSRCHGPHPKKHVILCPRWIHRAKVPPPPAFASGGACSACVSFWGRVGAGFFLRCCFLQLFLPNFWDRMPAPYSAEDVAASFAQFPKLKQVS